MKEFIKKMLSGSNDVSSKRSAGLYAVFVVVTVSAVLVFTSDMPWELKVDLLKFLFTGGLLALGVAAIEKFWAK